MKTRIAVLMLCCGSLSWAECHKGYIEYKGNCYPDIRPESEQVDQSKWVSDEKPPRDKMPSYQRERITVNDIKPYQSQNEEIAGKEKWGKALRT